MLSNALELDAFKEELVLSGEIRGVWIGYDVTTSTWLDGRQTEAGFNLPWWPGFPHTGNCAYALCVGTGSNCQLYFLTKNCASTDNLVFCND